ncbi:MAG: hypothetical protein ACKPCM_01400 [Pseudanabaena sp.]
MSDFCIVKIFTSFFHKPDRLSPQHQTAIAPSTSNTRSPIPQQTAMSHQKTKSGCKI